VPRADGKYEGEWHHGLETGQGRHSWNDGSYYEGEWVEGRQNGHGTYVWKSGNLYARPLCALPLSDESHHMHTRTRHKLYGRVGKL
jgi:hypothetical protein